MRLIKTVIVEQHKSTLNQSFQSVHSLHLNAIVMPLFKTVAAYPVQMKNAHKWVSF